MNNSPEEPLKPCPFCGDTEIVMETIELLDSYRKVYGCSTECCPGYQSISSFSTEREAREAWNTRLTPSLKIWTAEELWVKWSGNSTEDYAIVGPRFKAEWQLLADHINKNQQ